MLTSLRTLVLFGSLLAPVGFAATLYPDIELSPQEKQELDQRLESFYSSSEGDAMNRRIPKFNVQGESVEVNSFLRSEIADSTDPLGALAQEKGTASFRETYCKEVLAKKFTGIDCDGDSIADTGWGEKEKIYQLAQTWMQPEEIVYNLDQIPQNGKSHRRLWSDDYWRTQYGQTSYRYSRPQKFSSYEAAVENYAQPSEWLGILPQAHSLEAAQTMAAWSPAEKYDLTAGDQNFSLTNQQKGLGKKIIEAGKVVESWFGLCHGWAAASVMIQPPKSPVRVTGAYSVAVDWYPSDVRAMATLSWANGKKKSNGVGTRCNVKKPTLYPNGRIAEPECFDTNPATFHLALGNLLGRKGTSFIMDASFDYEVWNQPIYSYATVYFNPYYPQQRSYYWGNVAVPYDSQFKRRDRFQRPLTRGVKQGELYNDTGIRYVVGVITSVNYASASVPPMHSSSPGEDFLTRATYTYDLEFYRYQGRLIPMGGEWHSNSHPDFLWVPQRHSTPEFSADRELFDYRGEPEEATLRLAPQASSKGGPLCQLMKYLIYHSTGTDSYRCSGS